jgi:hypothetical protein
MYVILYGILHGVEGEQLDIRHHDVDEFRAIHYVDVPETAAHSEIPYQLPVDIGK